MEEYFKNGQVYIWRETFAMIKAKNIDPQAFVNIIDKHEITVIIDENKIEKNSIIEIVNGWKIFTLDIVFPSTFFGVTAKIANALAKENISIMPIAAYSRDHFLIKEENMVKAASVFKKLGIKTKYLDK